MNNAETKELLALDTVARLATLDSNGAPIITPLWFIWEDGAFYMTSVESKRHLQNIRRDQRAALCIDIEGKAEDGGIRPNRQVSCQGLVELTDDNDGYWTRRITSKFIRGHVAEAVAERRSSVPRMLIKLRPSQLIATGTP